MAQETERDPGRPHLRPVPEKPKEAPAEVDGALVRKPGDADFGEGEANGGPPAQERDEREPLRGVAGGLTAPTRRGGSGRFVTDHLVELGFTTRDRVDNAIAESRKSGHTPEQVLIDGRDVTRDQLAR